MTVARDTHPDEEEALGAVYADRHASRRLHDDPESLRGDEAREYFETLRADLERKRSAGDAMEDLDEFFVDWHNVAEDTVVEFSHVLDVTTGEREVAAFLKKNPQLLALHLGGGHGRWVLPEKRLGAEYAVDFMVGEKSSLGFEWHAVELEAVDAKMYTQAGDQTAKLTHAIRQVEEWRVWLQKNLSYAVRRRSDDGLGLEDIDPNVAGIIIIGRSTEVTDRVRDRRKLTMAERRIAIRSYDWLLDKAVAAVRR